MTNKPKVDAMIEEDYGFEITPREAFLRSHPRHPPIKLVRRKRGG